ncbi:hypothetical protein ACIQNG_18495 [Streptomyces sp. NPDC091377]|uniref:hypothetical protein n=1 Tax=Streptomyces sp. NPDC091377 TaxID=3365995 RepID=UPI0037F58EBB
MIHQEEEIFMGDPSDGSGPEGRDQEISKDAMATLAGIKEKVSKAIRVRGPIEKRTDRSGLGNAHGVGIGLPAAPGGKYRLVIYVLKKMDRKEMKAALDSLLGKSIADTLEFELYVTDVQKQQQWPNLHRRPVCGSTPITPNPLGCKDDRTQPPMYVPGQVGWWPAGTMGTTLQDQQGDAWLVSCNHVLAQNHVVGPAFNRWHDVHQPEQSADPQAIANHIEVVPLTPWVPQTNMVNFVDVAVARIAIPDFVLRGFLNVDPNGPGGFATEAYGPSLRISPANPPASALPVSKCGPFSGRTGGALAHVNVDVQVNGSTINSRNEFVFTSFYFVQQFTITVAPSSGYYQTINGQHVECFSIPGDSGSFVFDDLRRPIGMLISGWGGTTTVTPVAALAQMVVPMLRF